MGIKFAGKEEVYVGAVIGEHEHMWMDGMLEVWTEVWNIEKHCYENIATGYYGSDCCNMYGGVEVEFDLCPEVARDILKATKREAIEAHCRAVAEAKEAIEKGATVKVVRGKKVPVGTELEVFWVGERPTYASRYRYSTDYEKIAGCYDADGNKVWIKTEYLKRVAPVLKSPNAHERDKFIKAYVQRHAPKVAIEVARYGA